jgi:hypothetical protein
MAGDVPEWIRRHCRAQRIIKVIQATPYWCDRERVHEIEREARRRSRVSTRQHVVDHIVPITHKLVCGLNIPQNMRIITQGENAKRGNRWWEFTEDLFTNYPEQLSLSYSQ